MTDTNISKAEDQCKASATLRGVIDSILSQCSQDVETQRANVNLAFQKRSQEIAEAKLTLEEHLAKVCKQGQPTCLNRYLVTVLTIQLYNNNSYRILKD